MSEAEAFVHGGAREELHSVANFASAVGTRKLRWAWYEDCTVPDLIGQAENEAENNN